MQELFKDHWIWLGRVRKAVSGIAGSQGFYENGIKKEKCWMRERIMKMGRSRETVLGCVGGSSRKPPVEMIWYCINEVKGHITLYFGYFWIAYLPMPYVTS